METTIDLNADVGESFGRYELGNDVALIPLITSANVACGFHAGDPAVIERTLLSAKMATVSVGAHPGFDDKVGFGRRDLDATSKEVETDVAYQIAALQGMSRRVGLTLRHVKAHGALYNMAWRNGEVAKAIAAATASVDSSLILVAPAGSRLEAEALAAGLQVAREAFVDRAYNPDGTLVSRRIAGAVLEDPSEVADRALGIVLDGGIRAIEGTRLTLIADTLCLHGDNPGAVGFARAIREVLARGGVAVKAMGTPSPEVA